ncbi:MAG: hypothetical protein JW719_06325 [Pirellulales bacterium]|nr:hypothetical protein [Pirellulales bacterium]
MSETPDVYYQWLGIPPSEQPPDAYRLLGLRPRESDPEVIQNAADRQMLHLRTYQLGPHAPLAEQLLNEVAAARLTLLNPDKKAEYDRRLSDSWTPRRPATVATTPASTEPALLGVPRPSGAAPLAPLPRRRFRRAVRRVLPMAVVIALFCAAVGLLVHVFSSLLPRIAPSSSSGQTESRDVPPATPAESLPAEPPAPEHREPSIVIERSAHGPAGPRLNPNGTQSAPLPPSDPSRQKR